MINKLAKQAHEYATRIGAYLCPECKGKQQIPTKHDTNKLTECFVCSGTGKSARWRFIDKINEEHTEFVYTKPSTEFHKDSEQSELADIILVCFSYAIESGYDVEKILRDKIEYNKTR